MSYYNSEEEFLSAYTARKLILGGRPVVCKEELEAARDEFLQSVYCSSNLIEKLNKLNFNDLEKISELFQQKASINRSWLKPCFVYKDEQLYPTYNFFDFTQTTYGEFVVFLSDERYNIIPREKCSRFMIRKQYEENASKVATYLTKYFANEYIKKEIKNRRWPKHLSDVSYLLDKDLGRTLELEGTQNYFRKFRNSAFMDLGNMLTDSNGNLRISNERSGTLAYNNLKRMLTAFPEIDTLCSAYYEKDDSKFNITIKDNIIKCNETTLVDEDPYEEFSDSYSSEEKSL